MKKRAISMAVVLALLLTLAALPAVGSAEAELVKLKGLGVQHTLTKNFADMAQINKFAQEAGVEIEWTCIKSDWDALKSTMFASMDLPDFFFGNGAVTVSDIISNKDLFVKLNDSIAASTNIKGIFESDPYMGQLVTLTDGSIYCIPSRLPIRPYTATGVFINKTWLDKLSLAMPTTLDELYNVLVAMKKGDPNGNGQADEYPWVGCADATDWLMGSFGVAASNYNMMMDDAGKLSYVYATDAYKQAIAFEAKCFAGGVIDPEIFTQDWSAYYASSQAATETVGLGSAWTMSALFGTTNRADYVTLPIMKASADDTAALKWPGHPATMSYTASTFSMTVNCAEEKRAKCFGFVDNIFTDKNSIQICYGPEGDALKFNDDGTVAVLDPPTGTSLDDWQWTVANGDKGPQYVSPAFESNIVKQQEQYEKYDIDQVYRNNIGNAIPFVMFDTATNDELSVITTDIDNIRRTYRSDWITGVASVDDQWDTYLTDIKAAGLDRLVEIYQTAVDAAK